MVASGNIVIFLKSALFLLVLLLPVVEPIAALHDGAVLRTQVLKTYPSLLYVDRYRRSFPREVQGTKPFWSSGKPTFTITQTDDLVAALAELQDQHAAIVGPHAGRPETLGMLFRTSTDGNMIVWRIFDSALSGVAEGDRVLAIDGVPTQDWLRRTALTTFGGNRRGRYAEAATELGLGTPIVHRTARLGKTVRLRVQPRGSVPRTVTLLYRAMNAQRAKALTIAIDRPDLPVVVYSDGYRIGSLRIGSFAPQYDPVFVAASERASHKPGATDDEAMLAGYCAVTASFIKHFEAIALRSDAVVIDLRGNLGGFDREARLKVNAIAATPSARTFDLFATAKSGTVRLSEEQVDPSCGHVSLRRPIVVLDDAATRSSGELMAAWLWTSRAAIVGERTVGAGGGFESDAAGFPLPRLRYRVRTSGNFTIFDPTLQLNDGAWSEHSLVATVAAHGFSPSRNRPFAIQCVGVRPDVPTPTTLADLRDGGIAQIKLAISKLRRQRLLE